MTVITIIGMLAAMSFGMFRLATNKAAKKNTIARLAGIQLGIESYKTDNGEYPEALGLEDTTAYTGGKYIHLITNIKDFENISQSVIKDLLTDFSEWT